MNSQTFNSLISLSELRMVGFSTDSFTKKIHSRELQITVVGMGKMGIPIAMVFCHAGYHVRGYDISDEVVEELNEGNMRIENEPNVTSRLVSALKKDLFHATADAKKAFKQADVIITIIPVLTDDYGNQHVDNLLSTYSKMSSIVEKEVIYIQESTIAPGTTTETIKAELEKGGKRSGVDFGLVFSPERTRSGQVIADIEDNYPKIIGADTENAARVADELYKTVCRKGTIIVSNPTTAEAVKTFKGAYRDANIAIANQFAVMADLFGVDVIEVINAANSEPSSHIHQPGIGVGGHCIPVYPHFLISKSKNLGFEPDILTSARRANLYMVDYAVDIIKEKIDPNEPFLVMGLAFRGGVKEHRNSPTLDLVPKLRSLGYTVFITDPLYSSQEIDNIFGDGNARDWHTSLLNEYQNFVIVTDHVEFRELENLLQNKFVYDGRYIVDIERSDGIDLFQPGRYLYTSK